VLAQPSWPRPARRASQQAAAEDHRPALEEVADSVFVHPAPRRGSRSPTASSSSGVTAWDPSWVLTTLLSSSLEQGPDADGLLAVSPRVLNQGSMYASTPRGAGRGTGGHASPPIGGLVWGTRRDVRALAPGRRSLRQHGTRFLRRTLPRPPRERAAERTRRTHPARSRTGRWAGHTTRTRRRHRRIEPSTVSKSLAKPNLSVGRRRNRPGSFSVSAGSKQAGCSRKSLIRARGHPRDEVPQVRDPAFHSRWSIA